MPSGLGATVELHLGKILTSQAQDLNDPAQLAVLPFQRLDALAIFAGLTGTLSSVGLLATNPTMQGMRCTANLRGNGLIAAHSDG